MGYYNPDQEDYFEKAYYNPDHEDYLEKDYIKNRQRRLSWNSLL